MADAQDLHTAEPAETEQMMTGFAAAKYRAQIQPPDGTPLGNLRHVVSAFAESAAGDYVVRATSNIYESNEPGVQTAPSGATFTGLTHGDLRELLRLLDR